MASELLTQSAVLLGAAVVTVPVFQRLGLGSVLGYLAAGAVVGPAVLGVVDDPVEMMHFAEFGVVMLLFLIGLELDLERLWSLRRDVFGLGGAQVVVTAVLVGALGVAFGLTPAAAVVAGSALALSSTAFGLQILGERDELASAYGRKTFAVLLFQDLAVIPLLALIPLLGERGPVDAAPFPGASALIAVGAVVGVIVAGRLLLRPLLRVVAGTRIVELSTAVTLFVVVGVSLVMIAAGLSMALGAFIAGVLLADSEFRHELEANLEPFKGLLLGLFFMSVGMAAEPALLVERPLAVLGVAAGLVALKGAVLFGLGTRIGLAKHERWRFAVALSQGGEFAFVLFAVATGTGALDAATVAVLTMSVTLSMVATPLLFAAVDRWGPRPGSSHDDRAFDTPDEHHPVIIAGFGRYGQIIGRVLRMKRIPFTALEGDAQQVDFVRQFGNRVFYGDSTRPEVLRAAGVASAKAFIIALDNVEASTAIARTVRTHFPDVILFARARNRRHAHVLLACGVHHVYRETYASSLETTQDVLEEIGLPYGDAREAIRLFREHDEDLLQSQLEIMDDMDALQRSARESIEHLESLFGADERSKGGRRDVADAA